MDVLTENCEVILTASTDKAGQTMGLHSVTGGCRHRSCTGGSAGMWAEDNPQRRHEL